MSSYIGVWLLKSFFTCTSDCVLRLALQVSASGDGGWQSRDQNAKIRSEKTGVKSGGKNQLS